MSRFYSHINTATALLSSYRGAEPFSVFLKDFFKKEKKYGGRDRKTISALCYHYFRIGFAFADKEIGERLLAAEFLQNYERNEWLDLERPEWSDMTAAPLNEKLHFLQLDIASIFPFQEELSEGIDPKLFNLSFLIQPRLFIRVRPGMQAVVKGKLGAAGIDYKEISEYCFSVQNGTKLEDVMDINREAVIQDLNSQRVSELLPPPTSRGLEVWDCCAASGGKSIMAYDFLQPISLTVSDVRQSIITNLRLRFKEAGIKGYRHFVADLTKPAAVAPFLEATRFDLIICDAPCCGSGTWSRTPEQLLFFQKNEIERYSTLQQKIATAAIPYLKTGGYFLYITCSVFKKENEEVANFIQQATGIRLVKMELLKGYESKADTMFAALFQVD